MDWKFWAGMAALCFLGTVFVGANVLLLMMAGVWPFVGPPQWLAFGLLAALWCGGAALVADFVEFVRSGK